MYKNTRKRKLLCTYILKTANFYRNICAHEERLYNFKINKKANISNISKILNISSDYINNGNVFTIAAMLKLVLTKEDYLEIINDLDNLFIKYNNKFKSVNFIDILIEIGFDENWQTTLK
ncbi:MAG: hypothetical protein R3Y64_10455 [Peptostreptococcaceae bacterium]